MWRCQREKLKEDAIQCCGKKDCEKKFLDSVPPIPPKKTVTIQSAERVIESYIPGYRPQCMYKNHVVTETREVLGICEVKKVSKKICAPNVTCVSMDDGRQCDNVIVDELYCNEHDGRLCKKWKESFTSVCNDDEQIGSIYHQTVCGEVVEYKCVEW